MDKINQVMDMIEHPEKYSEAQIKDILQDEECRETYLTMVEIRMAFDKKNVDDNVDLDKEWNRIMASQSCDKEQENSPKSRSQWRKLAASFVGVLLLSGIALAAIHSFSSRFEKSEQAMADTVVVKRVAQSDTLPFRHQKIGVDEKRAENFHKTFDNVALSGMLAEMAKHYRVEVEFRNQEAKLLRFYYEWNSDDPLQKVLDELNHSQQVNLSLENETIIVE